MDAASIATLIKETGEFLKSFGLASGALLLLSLAAWRVWSWFRPHGDKILQAHVSLVDTLRIEAPKQTTAMQTIGESVSQIANMKQIENHALRHMSRAIEEIPECEDRRKAVLAHTQNAREALDG